MPSAQEQWLRKLGQLKPNVSLAKGPGNARFAPHKPLLLLCLIDAAESGELTSPELTKTPALRLRFDSYWSIVQPRWGGKPGLDLPFYHLHTQGFWQPRTREDQPAHSPESTQSVRLDPGFLNVLQDPAWRDLARGMLIDTWFTDSEQAGLYAALGFSKEKIKALGNRIQEAPADYIVKGRDARFRVVVATQYRFTCALTGHGLHTITGATLIQAAHIHQFAKSQNDSPRNGIALRHDAHWMFDEGLWTVDEKERVCVAKHAFTEWGPECEWLKARHGKKLVYADGVTLRPDPVHFAWHREKAFKG